MYKAELTLRAIEEQNTSDQCSKFRRLLRNNIARAEDAYRETDDPFRTRLGASAIGANCARAVWYGFRWAALPHFEGRLLRLFNRGHLEEARFITMLECIDVKVFSHDEKGDQYKFPAHQGHFGCTLDGVALGLPELKDGTYASLEFKTHNDKSFTDLVKNGVQASKPEHYIQMQVGMRLANLPVSLYMAVSKNDDKIHAEYLSLDVPTADQYIDRAGKIIWLKQPPPRLSESPGWFECKWCSFYGICHKKEEIYRSCRNCKFAEPSLECDKWICHNKDENFAQHCEERPIENPIKELCHFYDSAA
jgi:hypothetical protein